MSEEILKVLLETVTSDISLQEKLQAAKSPDEAGRIGIEHDHEFSADDFNQLSNEEPEGIAGARALAQQMQSFGATNTFCKMRLRISRIRLTNAPQLLRKPKPIRQHHTA